MGYFGSLPDDMTTTILENLDLNDLFRLKLTSNAFNDSISDHYIRQRIASLNFSEFETALNGSVHSRQTNVLKHLLADARLKDDRDGSLQFVTQVAMKSCRIGYVSAIELFKVILVSPNQWSTDEYYSTCLLAALQNRSKETLKYLIEKRLVSLNQPFRPFLMMANANDLEAMKILLFDDRVQKDPILVALDEAIQLNHIDMVQLLVQDPRILQARDTDSDYIVAFAAAYGTERILEYLISDVGMDPSARNDFALENAIRFQKHANIQLLLADPRVNPQGSRFDALTEALHSDYDSLDIVLSDPRVQISDQAVRLAISAPRISTAHFHRLFTDHQIPLGSPEFQRVVLSQIMKYKKTTAVAKFELLLELLKFRVPDLVLYNVLIFAIDQSSSNVAEAVFKENRAAYHRIVGENDVYSLLFAAFESGYTSLAIQFIANRRLDRLYSPGSLRRLMLEEILRKSANRSEWKLVAALLKAVPYSLQAIDYARSAAAGSAASLLDRVFKDRVETQQRPILAY